MVISEGDETKTIYEGERGSNTIDRSAMIAFKDDPRGIEVLLKWQKVHCITESRTNNTYLTGEAYYIVFDPNAKTVLEVRQCQAHSRHFSDKTNLDGEETENALDSYQWLNHNFEIIDKLPKKN